MRCEKAAALLGVTPRAVRYAAASGALPGAERDGHSWDIPVSAVAHALAKRTRPGRDHAPEGTPA